MGPLMPAGYDVVSSALALAVWLVVVGVLTGAAGAAAWALSPPGAGEPVGRARLRRRERAAVTAATAAGLLLPLPLVLLLGLVTSAVALAALASCVVLVAALAASAEGAAVRTAELGAEEPSLPYARSLAAAPVLAAGVLALVGLGTWLFPPALSIVTFDDAGVADARELFALVPPLPRPQDVVAAVVAIAVLVAGGTLTAWWSRNRPLALTGVGPDPSVVGSLRQRVRFRLRRAVAAGSLLLAGLQLALGYGTLRLADGLRSNDDWEAGVGALGLLLLVAGCVVLALRPPRLVLAPDDLTPGLVLDVAHDVAHDDLGADGADRDR